MNRQEMNLNIRYDLPTEVWDKLMPEIYQALDGWIGFGNEKAKDRIKLPHWFSFNEEQKHICASVEPSGLHFTGLMEDADWENWKREIKKIASHKLGFKVGEIELDEV
jgi:hypothetical protein